MPVKYPVARSAVEILNVGVIPPPRSYRESDAVKASNARVAFVSEYIGAEYRSEDEALDRYKGLVEDLRPGSRHVPDIEDRIYSLVCRFRRPPGRPRKQRRPDGAKSALESYWTLSVSYWKIIDGKRPPSQATMDAFSDKRARRRHQGKFSSEDLAAIANTPLRPTAAQQPLDFGLFEFEDPLNPGTYLPDE